ncbi:hypothetical protein Gotur_029577 [Gossypium turneri]
MLYSWMWLSHRIILCSKRPKESVSSHGIKRGSCTCLLSYLLLPWWICRAEISYIGSYLFNN